MSKFVLLFCALPLLVLVLVGCRESAQPTATPAANIEIDLTVDPAPPTVGETLLVVTVMREDGSPINDAIVAVVGDMNHAGMQPVNGATDTAEAGVYRVPFEWTMGGDWIVTVTVTLRNGTIITETFDLSVES